jgi:hypothetical protein
MSKQRLEEIREKAEKGSHADFLLSLTDEQAANIEKLEKECAWLNGEIARIMLEHDKEVERLKGEAVGHSCEFITSQLQKEIQRLRDALEFYASGNHDGQTDVARAALEGKDEA